jgi:cyclophilin family peptidyl-prolyl cis-trans isomerase
MWDRIRTGRSRDARPGGGAADRAGRRRTRNPLVESLEERQLLASGASLAAIQNQTVSSQQGLVVALDGSGTTDNQSFTVTSSNPDIAASIINGPIWTVDVQYIDPTTSQTVTEPLVFQLFDGSGNSISNLTANTVSQIANFTTSGFYTDSGKYITRIKNDFPGTSDYIVQGGSTTTDGSGTSGQPAFNNQNFQQLALTSAAGTSTNVTAAGQLAMANSGLNTNDSQFFITTGSPNSELGYNYTIFGQLIPNPTSSTVQSDFTTLQQLTTLPVMTNSVTGEDSQPTNNPIFTNVTITPPTDVAAGAALYPSGTLLLDTTQAKAGETATITVTANDPSAPAGSPTTATESFTVTVGSYSGPTDPSINFTPFANATTATVAQSQSATVTLNGASGYPDTSATTALTYSLLSQPAHGTVTNFNPTTGTLTYTPSPGYTGTDTLTYDVTAGIPTGGSSTVDNGPNGTAETSTSNPGTVTITVSPSPPVHTGAVRQLGTVLLITPVPTWNRHKTNTIDVVQAPAPAGANDPNPIIEVFVNGQLDVNQPAIDTIDSIIAFGSKANDKITIDPSVTVPSTIDGGHGGRNVLKGGGTETVEHGWFGHNVLIGGSGPNQLIGRAGQVKFKPSTATDLIFAGQPKPRKRLLFPTAPGGTFYVYKKGRLIPVPLSNLYPSTSTPVISRPVSHPHKKK